MNGKESCLCHCSASSLSPRFHSLKIFKYFSRAILLHPGICVK
ncbi:hypothetical protein GCWU000341_00312 [Oribacterium sp. oral taxon 078 str. F0262]|nr:hypothetical protein GCWU000341_00312 [Oribacterium sp. oral taxon 078 str. F0262]